MQIWYCPNWWQKVRTLWSKSQSKGSVLVVGYLQKKRRRYAWDSRTVGILTGTMSWPLSQSQRKGKPLLSSSLLCYVLLCYVFIQILGGWLWWQEPFNAEPPRSALVSSYVTPVHLFYKRNHGPIPIVDHIDRSYHLIIIIIIIISFFNIFSFFFFQLFPCSDSWSLFSHLPATLYPSPDWSITRQSCSSKISSPCPSTMSLLLYSVLVTEELLWAKSGMLEGLDGMFLPSATVLFFLSLRILFFLFIILRLHNNSAKTVPFSCLGRSQTGWCSWAFGDPKAH